MPWRVCLEEAWEAYRAGSLPIGAAITDPDGRLLARGRNRIFESDGPPGLLSGHRLAHAEMNALLGLEAMYDERFPCVLYSTTEPCPLCTGAIRQYGVAELRYASRDPAGGSVALLEATPFMRRRPVAVAGPERADLEVIIMAMHTEYWLHRRRGDADWWLFHAWSASVPDGIRLGRALWEAGELRRLRDAGAEAGEVMDRLGEILRSS